MPGLPKPVSLLGAGCWTIGGPATNRGVPIGWDDVDHDAAYAGLVHPTSSVSGCSTLLTSTAWAAPSGCSAAFSGTSTATP